jgi:hypothetical protein
VERSLSVCRRVGSGSVLSGDRTCGRRMRGNVADHVDLVAAVRFGRRIR